MDALVRDRVLRLAGIETRGFATWPRDPFEGRAEAEAVLDDSDVEDDSDDLDDAEDDEDADAEDEDHLEDDDEGPADEDGPDDGFDEADEEVVDKPDADQDESEAPDVDMVDDGAQRSASARKRHLQVLGFDLRDAKFESLHPRVKAGPGAGEFGRLSGRIAGALDDWEKGGRASSDPLSGFTRPQLLKALREKGISARRGAPSNEIKDLFVGLHQRGAMGPAAAAAPGRTVRDAARERNRDIERATGTAHLLAKVDEFIAKKADPAVIRQEIDPALIEPGQIYAGADPAALKTLGTALDSGDMTKLRSAVTRLSTKAKLKPISRAGVKTTFDPASMEGVGGVHVDDGVRVSVIRRGATLTLPDGSTIQVGKAQVIRAAVPPVEATRAAGHDITPGHDELHHYWLTEGLPRWAESPKPWTTLVANLVEEGVNPEKAKIYASRWFIEHFGFAAGSDLNRVTHGQPPRGHRIGPG